MERRKSEGRVCICLHLKKAERMILKNDESADQKGQMMEMSNWHRVR
jgi:hypothetical protein